MSTIKPVHTSCKKCVFANYENNTQISCHMEYLDKYRNNKEEILEVYDEDKEFFVINNKKCIGYRENKWFEKLGLVDVSIEEKIKTIKETNHIDFALMVDLKNFEISDMDNLSVQLAAMTIKPSKIIFIRYQNDRKKHHEYDSIKKIIDNAKVTYIWRIQTMVGDDSHYEILNNAVNLNKKNRFFAAIKEPSNDLSQIIEEANTIVYNELTTFNIISNASKTVIIFSGGLYRYHSVVNKKNLLVDNNNYKYI